jgi:hypothetical protein
MLLVVTSGLLWVECGNPPSPKPGAATAVRKECPNQSGDRYYFPEGVLFPSDLYRDGADRSGAGKYLSLLHASSLSCGDAVKEGYRFLWIHSNLPAIVASVTRVKRGAQTLVRLAGMMVPEEMK